MDCERTTLEWSEHDFSNFDYGKGEALVITKLIGDEVDIWIRMALREVLTKSVGSSGENNDKNGGLECLA